MKGPSHSYVTEVVLLLFARNPASLLSIVYFSPY